MNKNLRDEMHIEAFEGAKEPQMGSIYQDENITVYAIPAASRTEGESTSQSSPPRTLKRKLSNSFDQRSPKRVSTEKGNQSSLTDELSIAKLVHMAQDPSNLQGSDAQHWREYVVSRMFPKRGGIPFKGVHPVNVGHLKRPLPAWNRSSVVTSYLGIGPETRGKFDANKAKELGVEGPDRGKLARGQSVQTSSGNFVTPDMCIAPAVPPSVSQRFIRFIRTDSI